MRTLPNLLTLARLVSAPYIAWLIASGRAEVGIWCLAAAGLTDALDGWLARRFGGVTPLGAYLDPIADKVLAGAVFLALGFAGAVPWWLVGIVFGRDILILAVAGLFLAFTTVRAFPPSVWGKVSTLCQLTAAGFALGGLAFPRLGVGQAAAALMWVAAAATVWSGVDYLYRSLWSRLRKTASSRTGSGERGSTGW